MLSDATRRREYDDIYASRRPRERSSEPGASANFFGSFANMFGQSTGAQPPRGGAAERPDADNVFADVFEEVRCILSKACAKLTLVCSSCAPRYSAMLRGGPGSVASVVPVWALSLRMSPDS